MGTTKNWGESTPLTVTPLAMLNSSWLVSTSQPIHNQLYGFLSSALTQAVSLPGRLFPHLFQAGSALPGVLLVSIGELSIPFSLLFFFPLLVFSRLKVCTTTAGSPCFYVLETFEITSSVQLCAVSWSYPVLSDVRCYFPDIAAPTHRLATPSPSAQNSSEAPYNCQSCDKWKSSGNGTS